MNSKKSLGALATGLKELGIECIVVADDRKENLQAARNLEVLLPSIKFEFYDSGAAVIKLLSTNKREEIGLILTDMEMETATSGLDVLQASFNCVVPAIVVSGGFMHAGRPQVLAFPGIGAVGEEKTDVSVWLKVLDLLVDPSKCKTIKALVLARKAGVKEDDGWVGEQIRKVVEWNFKLK